MIWQILLIVLIAAIFFPWVRRWLKTTLGLALGGVLIFALIVMMASGV